MPGVVFTEVHHVTFGGIESQQPFYTPFYKIVYQYTFFEAETCWPGEDFTLLGVKMKLTVLYFSMQSIIFRISERNRKNNTLIVR